METKKTEPPDLTELRNDFKQALHSPWDMYFNLDWNSVITRYNEEGILKPSGQKPLVVTSSMSKSYITLFNARDKAIARGVNIQYKLTDGGIEDFVEQKGFKKTLEMIKGL